MKTVDLENRLVRVNPIHLYRFVNSKDCGFRNFICELKDLSKAIEVVNACMEKVKNMKGSTKEEAEKLKIFLLLFFQRQQSLWMVEKQELDTLFLTLL